MGELAGREGVIVALALGLIVAAGLIRARQVWVGQAPWLERWPRRVVRAIPVFAVSLTVLVILGAWLVTLPDEVLRAGSLSATLAVAGVLGALLLGSALTATAVVWGRPVLLIPPPLRGNVAPPTNDSRPRKPKSPKRAPVATSSDTLPVTYRHRRFIVGHILVASVALPAFVVVFRAVMADNPWVQAAIYLAAAGLAVWFYLEGRRGIRVTPDGVTVIETTRKVEARWKKIDTFTLLEGEAGSAPHAYLELSNGRTVRLTGVDGGDFGRWAPGEAERLVGVLNGHLHEARRA